VGGDSTLQVFLAFLDSENYPMYRSQMKKYVERVVDSGKDKLQELRLAAELRGGDEKQALARMLKRVYSPYEQAERQADVDRELGQYQEFFQERCKEEASHNPSYL
jgi:hypothetical protein